jgi:hypothetical protein
MVFQVDSAEKLGDIVTENHDGPRLDSSCVIVHQPWATDQSELSESEQQLVRYCHRTLHEFTQPVIKLPELWKLHQTHPENKVHIISAYTDG